MIVSDLIRPEQVALDVRLRDKKQLLEDLGRRAAPLTGQDADTIVRALAEREQLGSTGLGRGFALPHARIVGLRDFLGLFLRLARPIVFDAIDEQPVDLVFLLLVPADAENQHVPALAAISRTMRNGDVLTGLRKAESAEEVYRLLVGP
ncbi:MAG TPA: PTS sugar transporter subunit IIA [Acetobacteraceae bacterium]|nr:PTS sugar transporter subunit IIA [Acetobacteraceae bacterium]